MGSRVYCRRLSCGRNEFQILCLNVSDKVGIRYFVILWNIFVANLEYGACALYMLIVWYVFSDTIREDTEKFTSISFLPLIS